MINIDDIFDPSKILNLKISWAIENEEILNLFTNLKSLHFSFASLKDPKL